jgi:hypothetical protein
VDHRCRIPAAETTLEKGKNDLEKKKKKHNTLAKLG